MLSFHAAEESEDLKQTRQEIWVWLLALAVKVNQKITGACRTARECPRPARLSTPHSPSPAKALVARTNRKVGREGNSGDSSFSLATSIPCKSHTTQERLSLNFSFRNNIRLTKKLPNEFLDTLHPAFPYVNI